MTGIWFACVSPREGPSATAPFCIFLTHCSCQGKWQTQTRNIDSMQLCRHLTIELEKHFAATYPLIHRASLEPLGPIHRAHSHVHQVAYEPFLPSAGESRTGTAGTVSNTFAGLSPRCVPFRFPSYLPRPCGQDLQGQPGGQGRSAVRPACGTATSSLRVDWLVVSGCHKARAEAKRVSTSAQ